jgi:5'-deoxynucleotidase YfbR-like HD superfamily hydrolase
MSKHSGRLTGAADFLKASYITRWGIVNCSRTQSIAEHMYRVWQLVRAWGPLANFTEVEQSMAEELALTHDLAEIRTGDCPTPLKDPIIKEALTRLEAQIAPLIKVSPKVAAFVKHCDTAESILFLKLYGQGKHADDVRELLTSQMRKRLDDSPLTPGIKKQLTESFLTTLHDT